MKLGLLTDIHEHVGNLRSALQSFQQQHVDLIVVIGDVFELGKHLDEACHLLADAGAIGVWGNHDYGLCVRPDDQTRRYRVGYREAIVSRERKRHPGLEPGSPLSLTLRCRSLLPSACLPMDPGSRPG